MTTPTMRLLAWATTLSPTVGRDLTRALALAQHAHREQFRRSGDPYIEHPVAVALILADHGADPATVIAAVLHDLRYAAGAPSVDALRADIGSTVADLVLASTRFDHPGAKIADARVIDHRVLQIRIADRLHTMRTIRYLPSSTQQQKSHSTREVMAPLARILGMAAIGDELDDLAIATLRAHDATVSAPTTTSHTAARPPMGVRSLHRALHTGAILLPAGCRHRWVQDWHGELYAACTLTERRRFATTVLLAMPTLAITTRRRTGPPC